MPILKKFTTTGGLELAWHRVVKAEAGFLDQHSVITLTVYSWPSMEAYIANQGQRFSWQEYVTIPQIRVDGTDFLGSCERAVVDLPESPYFQGAITTLPSDLTLARDLRWAQMKQMRDFLTEFGMTPSSRSRVSSGLPPVRDEKYEKFFGWCK